MDKLLSDLQRHWRAMWRYRRTGLLCAWFLAVIGTVIVFALPRKYEASARIFVNTESILKPLMVGMTVQPDTGQRVALLSRLVISRPNVEQLVRDSGLGATVTTVEARERLIDNVTKSLDIQSYGAHDNIYVVKFRDTEPERARRMVELLVDKFINTSRGGTASDSASAKRFLDGQTASYEEKLREAEGRLKDFKMRNMAAGEGMNYVTQLATVSAQLNDAQLLLREAEGAREALRRELNAVQSGTAAAGTPTAARIEAERPSDTDIRIDALKRELAGLRQRYTDSHPDVIGAQHALRDLQEARRLALADTAGVAPGSLTTAPRTEPARAVPMAADQIAVALAQAEASVASLRVRAADYANRYAQLQRSAERMPEFEAELARLNRDYDVNKKNYESLAARRESASIAGDMQSVAGVGDFRLIDPPRVAPSPVSTSRALMLIVTLIMAASAGLGLMFLAKEIRSRVFDVAQLRALTGLPVLGVVSAVRSPARIQAARRSAQRMWLGSAALLLGYVLVVGAGVAATWKVPAESLPKSSSLGTLINLAPDQVNFKIN
jgi:polysaccharide chain length determinant protein (PEP-CTERM system associated)